MYSSARPLILSRIEHFLHHIRHRGPYLDVTYLFILPNPEKDRLSLAERRE